MRKPIDRAVLVLWTALGMVALASLSVIRQREQRIALFDPDIGGAPTTAPIGSTGAAETGLIVVSQGNAQEDVMAAAGNPKVATNHHGDDNLQHKDWRNLDIGSKAGALSFKMEVGSGATPPKIKYIALIGERHSGSTWMLQFLKDYFKGKDITVTATLCTWKHWFQDRIYQDIRDGKRPCREGQPCPACKDINHTLVVAIWRNPYDWISGMHKIPWHAQAHAGLQDLSEFMTKPWIMGPEHEQLARQEAATKAKENAPCIDNFLPGEVLPCRQRDDSSIYELNPDGEAYGNLYELRKAKIKDFNAVRTWAPYYEKILYEDMLDGTGLRDWLRSLDTLYGLKGKYENVPGPALAKKMKVSSSNMYYMNSESCAPHCKMGGSAGRKALETMNRLWDSELEADIGYHKLQ